MQKEITLSVHELVDFLLRSGDIDERVFNAETMSQGSKMHSLYQAKQNADYQAEVALKYEFQVRHYTVTLMGRADGVVDLSQDSLMIDEIKTTNTDLEKYRDANYLWHIGQAKCYALMASKLFKKSDAFLQITYISQIDNKSLKVKEHAKVDELETYVRGLIDEYLLFYEHLAQHRELRNKQAEILAFPFPSLRTGQGEMIERVQNTVNKWHGQIMIEAPTGIGKTISALFPAVKSFANLINNRIFYLSAKTSGQNLARAASQQMRAKGAKIKEVVLTAKDKACINYDNIRACNPDSCPYAINYYTKLKKVITEMIDQNDVYDRETIYQYATKHQMCPFELQLDISLHADLIIGDYNYFFDPIVHLKRYFENEAPDSIVLVDEAHNLVERSRAMYSQAISTYTFQRLEKRFKSVPDIPKFKTRIRALRKVFNEYEPTLEMYQEKAFSIIPADLLGQLDKFVAEAKRLLKDHPELGFKDDFYPFFFEANRFLKMAEYFSDNYCGYFLKTSTKHFSINLLCLDASSYLKETYQGVRAVVLFSATLTPLPYYAETLGFPLKFEHLILPSPFSNRNLQVLIDPNVSTRYKDREGSYQSIAQNIKSFIGAKTGNYLVFVPSYLYLEKLAPLLSDISGNLFLQEREMDDFTREQFLEKFTNDPPFSNVGLAVIGGAFAEGIDLMADRLIGVVIIGVGMPQLSFERDVLRKYFAARDLDGFNYAYVIPGINKVRQAVGRLIRSETDVGAALFMDDRYINSPYREIFKGALGNYEYVYDKQDILHHLGRFYAKKGQN